MFATKTPLEQACEHFGSQSGLAAFLQVKPPTVNQWMRARDARPVPIPLCVLIEQGTGGKVKRWDLRPADWHRIWPEIIGSDGAPDVPQALANSAQEATETVASVA